MNGTFAFLKFQDLNPVYLNRDYQIHTSWTDGAFTPAEILAAAVGMGIADIAFTEHIRRESDYFPRFFAEVSALRRNSPIQVLIGVEAKVIDDLGHVDVSAADHAQAEIILGSVHRIPQGKDLVHPRDLGKAKTLSEELRLSLAMIECGDIDVLAHPLGMSLGIHGEFSVTDLETLIDRIAQTDVAFEINSKYTNPVFLRAVLDLCRKHNPYISIGSDVHRLEELGNCKRMLEAVL